MNNENLQKSIKDLSNQVRFGKLTTSIGADSFKVYTYNSLSQYDYQGAMGMGQLGLYDEGFWVTNLHLTCKTDTDLIGAYDIFFSGLVDGKNIENYYNQATKTTSYDLDGSTVTGEDWQESLQVMTKDFRTIYARGVGSRDWGYDVQGSHQFSTFFTLQWADDRRTRPYSESDRSWIHSNPPRIQLKFIIKSTCKIYQVSIEELPYSAA